MNDWGQHRSFSVAEVDRVWCNVYCDISSSVCVDCELSMYHQLAVCDDFELCRVSIREVSPCPRNLECDLANVSRWYFCCTEEHAAVHEAREIDVRSDCGVYLVDPLVGWW